MSDLNDNDIIHNTRIVPSDKGYVEMKILLPDGEEFVQRAKDAESAKKHIIAWCESVRGYVADKAEQKKEEARAKKLRKESGFDDVPQPASSAEKTDSRRMVMDHYDWLQSRIDELSSEISARKEERDTLRDERDKLKPIITVWRGEGEE